MRRKGIASTLFIISVLFTSAAFAKPKSPSPLPKLVELKVGDTAPEFSLPDGSKKMYKLSDYKGKYVVLEWYNKDCPFVRKQYDSNNMQTLQSTYTGKNVVWFEIDSAAEKNEGYLSPEDALKQYGKEKSKATALLLDPKGTVGRAYGAKTTPHMFVISPEGKIVYLGAIDDDKYSTDPATVKKANNYVAAALDAELATPKKAIATASTEPYGCGVKYKN
jgi:peroxiredoxin